MTTEQGKWKITPELLARARRIGEAVKQARIEFEQTLRKCPTHNKPSKFLRYDGSYTMVYAIFRCPEGDHEFPVK